MSRPVSLAHQIACVERELSMRRSVYRRLVANGAKRQEDADREIREMEAVAETLRAVAGRPRAEQPELTLRGHHP